MGKLVRDRIPELLRASGREPDVRVLTADEYSVALRDKLLEEAHELTQATNAEQILEEAADVYEVLAAIVDNLGLDLSAVAAAAADKRSGRGGFQERIWLEMQ